MKKKLFIFLTLVCCMMCLLAISISAATYTVNYNDGKAKAQTDENGVITLRDTKFSADAENKYFFGWYTKEGDVFKPGETITVTEDMNLYEAFGYRGTNDYLPLGGSSQWDWPYIQLQEDIYLTKEMSPPWGGCATVDLNGFNIYTSATNAVVQTRGGIRFVGEGTITHTGSGNFFNCATHGYGDGSQYLLIGKYVTVTTGGILFNYTNNVNSNIPLHVYGDVTCKQLARFNGFNASKQIDVQINPAKLEITGDAFITCGTYPTEAQISVNITGGTIVLSEAANEALYWNNDNAASYTITVSGGSFTNGATAASAYATGVKAVETVVNGVTYTTLVPSACEHAYAEKSTTVATCVDIASVTFECATCGDSYTVSYGTLIDHDLVLISDIPASTTSSGLKTFECTVCKKQILQVYAFDPTNLEIEVVVNTENGEETLMVKVSDVLNLTSVEDKGTTIYTLIGVKDFGEYLATDIISIEVPIGISEINFEANSTLKTLKIADYANTKLVSFKNTAITKIYIGAATILFKNGCSNNVIQAIYSDVSGANVEFEATVFNGKKSITELTYSAGSSYKFSTNSFKEVQVKELIFPDYCTVTFGGEAAFYNCAVEYLYIGLGNPTLAGKPFDYCQKMQKIVLMDVNKITGDYTFCVENGGVKPVEVYIHSETMSLTSNTFYQCHGIIVYTNAPLTTGFNACSAKTYGGVDYPAYTIYYGIGHKYTEGTTDPTCTADGSVGYVTDCPCGKVDEYKEYKVFTAALTNSADYETGTISTTVIPALGHSDESAIVAMVYEDYFKNARATYLCPVCEKKFFDELLDSALFTERGYSASETDKGVISYTLRVNKEAMDAYAPFAAGDLKYGLLVSANTDKAPILGVENDMIQNSNGTVIFEFSDTVFNLIQMKLSGIENIEFIACGYMMEGDRAFYIGQNTTSNAYSVITHAIVLEMIPKEEEPSDEVIPA